MDPTLCVSNGSYVMCHVMILLYNVIYNKFNIYKKCIIKVKIN